MSLSNFNPRALANDLRANLRGEVRFDDGSRALYATDASNYRQVPIGLVIPRDKEDVVRAVEVCRHYGVPLLPRGAGTSQAGQSCNVAVVIDVSKYIRGILELDPAKKLARVEPGTILDDLRQKAENHHLTFAPDPSTHAVCTLGGMVGNNSCGVHSLMGGKTVDNIEELEILTYDGLRMRVGGTGDDELDRIIREGGRRGEIYARLRSLRDKCAGLIRSRYPKIPRRVSGYNLDQLLPENGFHVARALVGTEGTCATILEATARLVDSPPARSLLVVGFPDLYASADRATRILTHSPIGLEGLDGPIIDGMKQKGIRSQDAALFPEGRSWLLIEFGGETKHEAEDRARALLAELEKDGDRLTGRVFDDRQQARRIWEVREAALAAASRAPSARNAWPGWEDAAVPPARLGSYLREFQTLLRQHGYTGVIYGHFGEGCVHVRIDFDLETEAGIMRFRSFVHDAADLVVRYGGSLSGEHGDGQARAELLPKMFGPELVEAFREFKAIWDPDGKMNPGKVVDAYRADENLRLAAWRDPKPLTTHFQFPSEGSFARATLSCVGVGKCRQEGGGTMCPSYRATREETHSTRGRARLLFEMLQGEVLRGGWQDKAVKDALDLCLACKGCKNDCPASVDMATYKAEFLSHYYAGRVRPRSAYALGLIHWWARLAAHAPGMANFLVETPLIRDLTMAVAGLARQRRLPAFASRTFKQSWRSRERVAGDRPGVILWPDTFNNHFHAEIAVAAAEVLEAMGFRVQIPRQTLCCGRPLYDYGMLDLAKRQLREILDALHPQIAQGVPVVGLEPSCVAVFRDELPNLFPRDVDAARLSRQTFLIGEFLQTKAADYQLPRLPRKALVHGHCHQKAIQKMGAEELALARLGLDFKILDSGCCGMAGGFGLEKNHYDLSIQVGEKVLLPAIRSASKDTLIIADGFSCREQIRQTTGRRAVHLAQVIRMAMTR